MEYREFAPGPSLKPYVAAFWTLHGASAAPSFDLVLPDGHAEVVIHRTGRFLEWHAEDEIRIQPAAIVAGVTDRAIALSPASSYETIGIRFVPYAMAQICDGPLDALDAGIAPADAVLGREPRSLLATAAEAGSLDEALHELRRGLQEVFRRFPPAPSSVVAAVRRIREAAGAISVDGLARETGTSARTLERRFDRWVGLSPKRFGRVVRFQNAVSALVAEPGRPGADHAARHGYYDQAHFTREFRAFTGSAPRAFASQRLGELTRCFVAPSPDAREKVSDSSKTPARLS